MSETDTYANNGKWTYMFIASHRKKKREDEMVTARHVEVNEWKAITEKERIMERHI